VTEQELCFLVLWGGQTVDECKMLLHLDAGRRCQQEIRRYIYPAQVMAGLHMSGAVGSARLKAAV